LLCIDGRAAHGFEPQTEPGASRTAQAARPSRIRADRVKPKLPTAKPPVWDQATLDVFFTDAREHLGPGGPRTAVATADIAVQPTVREPASTALENWSSLISRDTLEDEIKSLSIEVNHDVQQLGAFKSGGFEQAAAHFTQLAALFGVVAEYDGDVRWKRDAPAMAETFRRAGRNCRAASDAAYKEARMRADDLSQLVRGTSIETDGVPATDREAGEVLDRRPLMTRLETLQQERIGRWTATQAEFDRRRAELKHEAELLAAVAAIIQREGYEFADDDGYLRHAKELGVHAQELSATLDQADFAHARAAVSEINQSCDKCHTDYRN
jgi:hypothetical protein